MPRCASTPRAPATAPEPADPERLGLWCAAVIDGEAWLRAAGCSRVAVIGYGIGGLVALGALDRGSHVRGSGDLGHPGRRTHGDPRAPRVLASAVRQADGRRGDAAGRPAGGRRLRAVGRHGSRARGARTSYPRRPLATTRPRARAGQHARGRPPRREAFGSRRGADIAAIRRPRPPHKSSTCTERESGRSRSRSRTMPRRCRESSRRPPERPAGISAPSSTRGHFAAPGPIVCGWRPHDHGPPPGPPCCASTWWASATPGSGRARFRRPVSASPSSSMRRRRPSSGRSVPRRSSASWWSASAPAATSRSISRSASAASVPSLLSFLYHGRSWVQRGVDVRDHRLDVGTAPWLELLRRLARHWLTDPALGAGWDRWRA